MRYAVIGLGIGAVHARVAAKLEGLELVGVCDLSADRANASAAECGTQAYTDIQALLTEAKPEAVSLCTNPKSHLPLGKMLAEAGVHVLCEKPMAASVEECIALAEACEAAGVVLAVAQKKRFAPATGFLKEHVGGDFGAPLSLNYRFHPGQVPMDWFWAEDDGGGPLVENAVHVFDTLRYVIGEVKSIQGLGGTLLNKGRAPQLDIALGLLQFENGCVGAVELGTAAEWCVADEEFYVACEKATARWRGGFDCPTEVQYVYREEQQPKMFEVDYGTSGGTLDFATEISQFAAAVRGEETPRVSGRDAARSIACCLALKRAVREGCVIEV